MPGADGRFSSNAPGAIVAGTASPSTTGALDRATASRHPHKHRRRCCANPWDRLVNDQALHPSAEVTVADWLGPWLRRFGSAVAGVVPDRFPAYVRILHPARGPDGLPVRWAEVAAWSGRTVHRLAQFHAIRRPAASAPIGPPSWNGEDPPDGNLPTESRPRSLSRAGTTCCSPVRWRQHPYSAGPTPTAPSSPSPPPVLAAGQRLVRCYRDRPVLHPGRRIGGPRPGSRG
jgi:hypothetical protein